MSKAVKVKKDKRPGVGGGGGGSEGGFRNFTVEATGLHTAVAEAQTEFNKSFYLGNLETVVLSTKLEKKNVQTIIEQLMRDETADKLAVLTCTDQSAEEILSISSATPPASVIETTVSSTMHQQGLVPRMHLWEFWRNAEMIGTYPYAPLVTKDGENIKLTGTEVFANYAPTTKLGSLENLFYNFMAHKVRHISMTVPNGDQTFEVRFAKSTNHLSVRMNDGVATLHDDVQVRAELSSDEDRGESPVSDQELARYERVMADYIKSQSTALLRQLKDKGTDICGFGRVYVLSNPSTAEAMRNQWKTLFEHGEPDIQVTVHMTRQGSLI
ncbi:Ger(x)C family spore germination C-terminal domain-containing protein [Alicyclobacillus dauci]|uniref:Germination protein, Ger(X)C family n=1 Tax=Alicyclobacillus dauci TaxID=1475485 RepID=A0ABY6Z9F7_9BACL|nr:Ger(x)C family spore germination C-terminal domain-containing protein [Alicyclobacillus dauci]WAH38894.1 hypothetical protein NZD86_10645 [Alicyclobacillus dauci]